MIILKIGIDFYFLYSDEYIALIIDIMEWFFQTLVNVFSALREFWTIDSDSSIINEPINLRENSFGLSVIFFVEISIPILYLFVMLLFIFSLFGREREILRLRNSKITEDLKFYQDQKRNHQ
jgi:hypothetical protein